jgi:xylulokinase
LKAGYLIGVDIGTYSSKGVIVDLQGRVAAEHTVAHRMEMPHPGFFEQDADRVWWSDFAAVVKSILQNSNVPPQRVKGIGVSAIGSCVLPIDAEGRPLRKGILYGIDTRATEETRRLEELIGRDNIFRKTGAHLSSQSSGPKILWIRNHEPEVFRQARWFLTSQAYIVHKLTGAATIDVYTAGGYSPLFDVHKLCWDPANAQHVVPLEALPGARWSCEVAGRVTPSAAAETGLAAGTPVITGTTDAAAEAISAGIADCGDMMIMLGSSSFFIVKAGKLTPSERFWGTNFLEEGTYAVAGGMSTGGSLTTWFRDELSRLEVEREKGGGRNAFSVLAEAAADSPMGAKGLIMLPYFEGERTPLHDPKAKGVFFGLSLNHNRGDLYRAVLEGIAFGIRHNLEAMRAEGVEPKRFFAVGGGTKNEAWLQIVADICGIDLVVPEQQIGASYGDAFMAGVGAGRFKDLGEIAAWMQNKRLIEADPRARRKYDPLYEVFRSLYSATRPLMHELSDYQSGEAG